MEKKFKFSDKTTVGKIVYTAVVAILCVSAVVIGIVAAANKRTEMPEDTEPPVSDEGNTEGGTEEEKKPDSTVWYSPVVGEVVKAHSLDTPVFSDTLGEWRVHAGIDILTPEGAEVFCSTAGTVSAVYDDPRLGRTVEVTHKGGIVSSYSNLDKSDTMPTVGTTLAAGDRIGRVGDSSLSELADEAHLHFEIKVNGRPVNPLDYISEESKRASLGIDEI
ncbi:MAG: peptidoglycan DD-metalloendopeptidase family protein [Clostridia bacterium]|nr:peptidoglycan DD-metalloendopeptidase family protein [Clostridia bacterium]